jgi:hypothetical protein
MESTTLDRKSATSDADPVINCYVRKSDITESLIFGTEVTALCGDTFVVTAQGGGSTARKGPGATICHNCVRIFNGMLPGGDE